MTEATFYKSSEYVHPDSVYTKGIWNQNLFNWSFIDDNIYVRQSLSSASEEKLTFFHV